MGADVGALETRAVVDPDAHASRRAENLDQARVRLKVLRKKAATSGDQKQEKTTHKKVRKEKKQKHTQTHTYTRTRKTRASRRPLSTTTAQETLLTTAFNSGRGTHDNTNPKKKTHPLRQQQHHQQQKSIDNTQRKQ